MYHTTFSMLALALAMVHPTVSTVNGVVRDLHTLLARFRAYDGQKKVGAATGASQDPRLDTSKVRCRAKKAKIDSRDDDDLCSYVSCMDSPRMAVETGDGAVRSPRAIGGGDLNLNLNLGGWEGKRR